MAHNVSKEKRLRIALAAPVHDWHGYLLCISCQPCGRNIMRPVEAFPERWQDLPLGDLVSRLRCKECRVAPWTVALRRYLDAEQERSWWLPIRGLGTDHDYGADPGDHMRVDWGAEFRKIFARGMSGRGHLDLRRPNPPGRADEE